ncbi:MAG: hypothetical protein JWN75_843 [Candidatus Saccharibacteria bacterium]|nr:hypothetical protein [Candidatus Saccharibacteria bacterium]
MLVAEDTYNMNQPGQKISKTKIIVLISAFLVLLVVIGYFFGWRPTDTSYQAALNDITTLKSETSVITQVLSTQNPPYFKDTAALDTYLKSTDSYQQSLTSLKESPVINHQIIAKSMVNADIDKIASYGNSINNTNEAIKAYYAILGTCGVVRFNAFPDLTATQYDDCYKDISAVGKISNSGFKSQFLTPYTDIINSMMDTLTTANVTDAVKKQKNSKSQDALEKLYRETVIDYKLASSPEKELDNLQTILVSQKSSIIRF